ncbi:putative TRAF-like superfamily protein [Tripterygium wilfordii]|uniref:Putative TRAF-like superfamily protein n=1 Tax=Tripterygium wilfordii TaxID=458696 RepID=A0A7J7DW78_TRIWF|nr:uncharacterized protein LOC119986801 [Tripterygium wilfordii]XP_038687429.1 uncharacterized protein LOC119986801 [Tripterygium wilfordii]XP_038687437.1 uncharacterized protein LOC119986801 [Tripterygium wilfordii]KAF5750630.1 putative TRAF-like superfamily protein [Tripterygium wilfordii]
MDFPATGAEVVPEKIANGKDGSPTFRCDLCDTEIVHKIAQVFLPGLATACVDNTTGDLFKTPGSVAADIRTEMVDYLTQRSENFVAESVVLEGGLEAEASDHPYDIISDFVDDFASSKRNLFSRVSGWLLSEKREDRIDDFVQEMEINSFWLLNRREAIVQTLLKNVDFKNAFHCDMKFDTPAELSNHVVHCGYRPMNCMNEGCDDIFCANHKEKHDSVCPFKIIPCEQKCSDNIMRREMDRHCITVCPMKLVNCPFYAVGCHSTVPHCMINQHRSEDLHSHLLYILQRIHKEVSLEDLKQRVEQLEKSSSGQLAEARDGRSLTNSVRALEAKLGPLEVNVTNKASREPRESSPTRKESTGSIPTKKELAENSPDKKESLESSPARKEESSETTSIEKEFTEISLTEN